MKYLDLVRFEPVDTVIQLREADRREEAESLVRTYVISDRMADLLTEIVIPQLRLDQRGDSKGLLIVGNYGTGKSHLMSVLSGVAEHADLADQLSHPKVASAARAAIAGRFQVLRTEIGATHMALRDILFDQLAEFLAQRGTKYDFPSLKDSTNSKDPLIAMMARFSEKYPGQGLLVVVDELLEYLRSRREQDLIIDLNFLREIGEVCRLTGFRFIGGVQESLFDSPRFQFVADTVRRVRARFEQVRITREDVAYVVAERLLRKTDEQRAWICRYLERFAPLYPTMAERMDEFVRLFPVHPAYLEVFERVTLVEKRDVLRTLSRAMSGKLDVDVPEDYPGLISYDDYWSVLQQDPALRSAPEIREVLEKGQVLEDRIKAAYTRPAYRPLAMRLIHGLAVLRLSTGEIYAPMGVTAQELRDGLCVYTPLPEADADFLLTIVEVALKETIRTVSGQFISCNPENGQYYLDLKKDIDYDALIAEKALGLSDEQMDRYYFDALKRALECTDSVYVPGYRIWTHELVWPGHGVTRSGYLFFGAPNERSTAQPPRDFYLYFIQPYEPPTFQDEGRADEVFFRLTARDEQFEQVLQTFAGAIEMASISSGEHKQTYLRKAGDAVQILQRWLREHMPQKVSVSHQGIERRLAEWGREVGRLRSDLSILDLVNGVASGCLTEHFEQLYRGYPAFPGLREPVTEASRLRMAQEAIRWLSGTRIQAGASVLEGLGLLQDGQVRPRNSLYALHILEQVDKLRPGEVLNRSSLLQTEHADVERDPQFRLEPEWVAVLLLSLVYSGDAVLQLPGERIDSSTLDKAVRMPMETLTYFRFIERPRDLPLAAWIAVFELLELAPSLIRDTGRHDIAVETLQRQVDDEISRVLRARETLRQGLLLWQEPVLSSKQQSDMNRSLVAYKGFLESLRVFSAPGRLRNLRVEEKDVKSQGAHRDLLHQLERVTESVLSLQPSTAYLRHAETVLAGDDLLAERIRATRASQLFQLQQPGGWEDTKTRHNLQRELEALKADYVVQYMQLHGRSRLGQREDEAKKRLLTDRRLKSLRAMAQINLLPGEQLTRLIDRLSKLVSCWRLTAADLAAQPVCPHCGYKPDAESASDKLSGELQRIDDELSKLETGWSQMLVAELDKPETAANIEQLETDKKEILQSFVKTRRVAESSPDYFVVAVNLALQGVKRLTVPVEDLLLALNGDGAPCPPTAFNQRFQQFLTSCLADEDLERVRISLDW